MSLDVPFRHELVGFTVFRSRSFEHAASAFACTLVISKRNGMPKRR